MNKIYEFTTLGGAGTLHIREKQPPTSVTLSLSFQQGDQSLQITFSRDEFEELCSMPYRLTFMKPEPDKPLVAVPSYAEALTA